MATTTSAVGTDIASLYESISNFQSEINAIEERHSQERTELERKHKAELSEKNADFNKAKASFASYLKQAGIDTLLSTPTTKGKGKGKQVELDLSDSKPRKPRTSSDELKATLERNKAIYTSTYELGIDEKSGLPKRFKGRSQKNVDIDRMMKQDEEAYNAAQGIDNNTGEFAAAQKNLTDTIAKVHGELDSAYGKKSAKAAKAK